MSILDILNSGPIGAMLDGLQKQGGLGGLGDIFGGGSQGSSPFGGGSQGSSPFGGASQGSSPFGGIGSALESLAGKARSASASLSENAPGGMGGLLGAGALGAVLGNLLPGNAVKGVALAGAAAAAWNFYKKWAESRDQDEEETARPAVTASAPAGALPQRADPTAELIMRSMNYAARADGNIDAQEKARMDAVLKAMLPGENLDGVMASISMEPLDPARIASEVRSPEQGDDVYRLSCMTIDIDHFMERSYLDTLAKMLKIKPSEQKEIEAQAEQAKKSLSKAIAAR